MTDDSIEGKALSLPDRLRIIPDANGMMYDDYDDVMEAADLIEQHEAFKQEVSDAVEKAQTPTEILCLCGRKNAVAFIRLDQFIIPKPKPDPLVAAMEKMGWYIAPNGPADAENFRAALDALGFEIREKGQ